MTNSPPPTEVFAGAESSQLISKKSLARLIEMSVRSVGRKDAAQLIPRAIDLSGSKRWRKAEISAWIDAGCPARKEWEAMHAVRHTTGNIRIPKQQADNRRSK